MAAAVIELSETNLVGAVVTDGIANINFGGNDRPNIDFLTAGDKIVAGALSYTKYIRVHLVSVGSPAIVLSGIRAWLLSGTYRTAQGIGGNICNIGFAYAARVMTYATPINTVKAIGGTGFVSTDAQVAILTADPGTANLGIGGALAGNLAAPGYSDYWVMQMYTGVSTQTGTSVPTYTKTFEYSWVET